MEKSLESLEMMKSKDRCCLSCHKCSKEIKSEFTRRNQTPDIQILHCDALTLSYR